MTVIPERLIDLDKITLDRGAHSSPDSGMCFNEAAAWLAGEPHSDAPDCVSTVLRRYTMRLNDRWPDAERQKLKPYIERAIGTAGDGKDPARIKIAQQALATDLLPAWLRLAGMDAEATELERAATAEYYDLRTALRKAEDAAWARRSEWVAKIKAAVLEKLKSKPAADAAADAAAVAAAAAAAAAVAAAAADAAADAAAAAVVPWNTGYSAARKYWDDYFANNPSEKAQAIRDLAAAQRGQALDLLDRLIDPSVVA